MLKKFLVIVCLTVPVFGDFTLNILPSGASVSRNLNSSILFSCEVIGDDNPGAVHIRWVGPNGADIADRSNSKNVNERKYVEDDNGGMKKLYIKYVELGDAGNYTCVAVVDGVERMKSVIFGVFKDIEFESAVSPQHPAIHTDALIVCRVDGQPTPDVYWRLNEKKLDSDTEPKGKYKKVEDGLWIKNISADDNGVYQCSANVESEGRFDFRGIEVEVHVPPTMTQGPGTTEGIEDEEATISCKGEGFPAPEFKFFKGTNLMETDERIVVDKVAGEIIFRPLKEDDAGIYTCVALNDVGNSSAQGSLEVLVRPHITEFANKSNSEGQPVSLECIGRGSPMPTFEFSKVDREHPFKLGDNELDRISVISNGEGVWRLIIKKLMHTDAGLYTCVATNTAGKNEATAYLNVTYKPKFDENHVKTFYIWAGKTRNITCEADAQPPPTFRWSRNGDPMEDNSTYHVFQSETSSHLQVTVQESDQSWIYGELTCAADNGYGVSDIHVNLTRATIPNLPQSVEVQHYLPNGFILHVLPPKDDGGDPVNGYQVEYLEKDTSSFVATISNDTSDEDGEEKEDKNEDNDDDDDDENPSYKHSVAEIEQIAEHLLKVDHLKPDTGYVLRVRARNEVGLGEFLAIEARTEAIRRPYPIKISSGLLGDAFSYTIEWEKPESGGMPIKEYEFKYREKKIVEGQETHSEWTTKFREEDEGHPLKSFTLDELIPNSTYQLQVKAKNDIDWSDYSPTLEFQTREATEREYSMRVQSAMSNGTIIGLALFVLFLLLVVIDLTCYVAFRRGVTHALVTRSKERSKAGEKERVMEEGENKIVEQEDVQRSVDNPIDVDEDLLKVSDDDDIKKPPIIEETIEDEMDQKQVLA